MSIGETTHMMRACSLAEVEKDGVKVVTLGGRTIAVFYDQGNVYALDNRCPHMGFPLHRGTVKDGILTCHWHHAKFDLAGGCTFDPFADDVPSFEVALRGGEVWIDPRSQEGERLEYWNRKIREGLQQSIPLVLAKGVIALTAVGKVEHVVREAAFFGLGNRSAGWSTGLSSLTSMVNILPHLHPEDRPLAVYQGLIEVANSTAGQPPSFPLAALRTVESRPDRFRQWFLRSVEVRGSSGAERTLRTAIEIGLSRKDIERMVFGAATDHRYLDGGHALDFANKAFELLETIGWEHAGTVLPSLVGQLAGAQRMEETGPWREPVDLGAMLGEVYKEVPVGVGMAGDRQGWNGHSWLAELILDGPPDELLRQMLTLVKEGVPLSDLSTSVAYAAARRVAHFHLSNDFFDWETVHHSFTYANAVDQAVRRQPTPELLRAVFDGAIAVYLERFLNVPRQPLLAPTGRQPSEAELLDSFDRQGQANEAAQLAADLRASAGPRTLERALGRALLREDASFHMFQMYEAAVRQARQLPQDLGSHVMTGMTRYLAAHSPTARTSRQTFEVAARLHRGESLHGNEV